MIAVIALLLKVLPMLTGLLTLIGGINAVDAGRTVVTYGASPSSATVFATIVPLLLAGMSKLATVLGKQKLDTLLKAGGQTLGTSETATQYAIDVVDVGRIAVYAKMHAEAPTEDEREKIRVSADVAIEELRQRLFPRKPTVTNDILGTKAGMR